ncbi:MAG: hypothetical protein RLZ22_1437 [Verrucomicrobiota bacterium]|jgi:hypothetical protein
MSRTSAVLKLASAAVAAALLASCSLRLPTQKIPTAKAPDRCSVNASQPREPHVLMWMVADDWHTGLVFPYDWLLESGFIPPKNFGHPQFVTMSWGNTDAYSPEGIGPPWNLLRVVLTPTPAVMELIPTNWNVTEVMPHQRIWRKLAPRDKGPALADFLNKCSVTDQEGRPIVVRPSSWGKGVQLKSAHRYFIPRVCNVWTAQALECLGCEINPMLGLTANGLIRQVENHPNHFEMIWPGKR